MCGIAGSVGRDVSAIDGQLEVLLHRGSDARGVFSMGPGAIGQTRLAVIDLETGDPPITSEDGLVAAVLNGEIYNYRELRTSLSTRHDFRTVGDTEVLVHLAEDASAVELANALHGMFAFAVWDARRETLTLARDRVGKKPLYFWCDGTSIVFASEIKGVLAHPAVPRDLDTTQIAPYLATGYVPSPATMFAGIRSLPPGSALTFTVEKGLRVERYWRAPTGPSDDLAGVDLGEAARLVRSSLDVAVRRRLVADVPIGAFLSGGVDSTAVVGLMAQHASGRVKTFTLGFAEPEYDERPYAREVAAYFDTEHAEFVAHPDAVELIDQLLWHHDQPFADSSAIPTFLLAQLARAEVKVALSGDGGDELFAGYDRFRAAVLMARFGLSGGLPLVGSLARRTPGWLPNRPSRVIAALAQPLPGAYVDLVRVFDTAAVQALTNDTEGDPVLFEDVWQQSDGQPLLSRLLHLNLLTYLPDDLLVKMDRMSMAHALEVRSPLLDHELLEVAHGLPARLHVGFREQKRVLRRAVADLLPGAVARRPKKGFGVPLDRWMRDELASTVRSQLGPHSRAAQFVNGEYLSSIVEAHVVGRRNHGQRLWTLLMLEAFLRREGW